MARLGGADEIIVRDVERFIHGLERGGILIGKSLGCDAVFFSRLGDLFAVLVSAGQEHDIFAIQALKTRHDVGQDGLIRVAEVRQAVYVGDSGGDVKLFTHLISLSS